LLLQRRFALGTYARKLGEILPGCRVSEEAKRNGQREGVDFSYSSREASTAWKNSATPSPVMLDTPTDWEIEIPRINGK